MIQIIIFYIQLTSYIFLRSYQLPTWISVANMNFSCQSVGINQKKKRMIFPRWCPMLSPFAQSSQFGMAKSVSFFLQSFPSFPRFSKKCVSIFLALPNWNPNFESNWKYALFQIRFQLSDSRDPLFHSIPCPFLFCFGFLLLLVFAFPPPSPFFELILWEFEDLWIEIEGFFAASF